MKKYDVDLTGTISVTVRVKVEDEKIAEWFAEGGEDHVREMVIEQAFEDNDFFLCAQCSGYGGESLGRMSSAEVDELELAEAYTHETNPEYSYDPVKEVKE